MEESVKRNIVVSAVNLSELGPLSVLKDALRSLTSSYSHDYQIVALVHRCALFDIPGIQYFEYPTAKSSWLLRIYWEYFGFKRLSRKLKPRLWISMHDTTPNVTADMQVVYCHNPSPFLKIKAIALLKSPSLWLYTVLYRYLYRINIHKNNWVVVQQDWLRKKFRDLYGVRELVVAHPHTPMRSQKERTTAFKRDRTRYIFFYPCFPRIFKNIDVVVRAADLLEKRGVFAFQVWLTMDGSENHYAAKLAKQILELNSVKLLGRLSREDVFEKYGESDCLLFPSLLETWGMPISEFKEFARPMLLADLPYAHETAGEYDQIAFFPAEDEKQLADMMQAAIEGRNIFSRYECLPIEQPYCASWEELFDFLLKEND